MRRITRIGRKNIHVRSTERGIGFIFEPTRFPIEHEINFTDKFHVFVEETLIASWKLNV